MMLDIILRKIPSHHGEISVMRVFVSLKLIGPINNEVISRRSDTMKYCSLASLPEAACKQSMSFLLPVNDNLLMSNQIIL